MYKLGDIYDQIKDSLARGSTLDAIIPSYTQMAARWIERNYSLKYMERFAEFNMLTDSEQPRMIELPNRRIKSIRFLRIPQGDEYFYLKKIDPQDQKHVPKVADSYWQDGWCSLVLSAPVAEDTLFEIGFYEYSAWNTGREACHWLSENCPDLLTSLTLMRLARRIRDERMFLVYKGERDEALKTLMDSNDESDFSDMAPVMDYRGPIGTRTPRKR